MNPISMTLCRGFLRILAPLVLSLTSVCAAAQPQVTLTVSAAASLTDALKEVAARLQADRPGLELRLNFAASGVLLQQIAQGAPVDVFASADQATMDRAAAGGLIVPATRRDFASNLLVLVSPAQAPIASLADLRRPEVRRVAIGKPATVPAGRYAQQVLDHAGLASALAPRLVPADNVRQVLDYVARAEVDAGFVYRTDAQRFARQLRIVPLEGGYEPVRYPVAVVKGSAHAELARELIDFLLAPQGQEILARHGFGRP
ncbi:MAG: molybdate ABC transporter substrate-binding protein [Burkholderiales bacterium]|nr:molybdate ABC transporter substrate-binding protein [Burkholderiales bacterium]